MIVKKSNIITGLDIGSSKVAAVAAEIDSSGLFKILAQVTQPSKGVSKGAITDLNAAINSVSSVLSKLRDKTSKRCENIYVNVSGQSVKGARSRGMVPLALRGREVRKADMAKCIEAASTIHLPFDREIIHKIVHRYSIDDQSWIKSPLGLYASRLSCEVYIITAGVTHIQNIYKCVNDSGYDISQLVFTGIADAAGILDKAELEDGVVLVDMGDSLTEVSMYLSGKLSELDIIPFGAKDIKGDFKDDTEFNNVISRIASRCEDFLKTPGKIRSVTLTGGLAFTDGLIEYLETKLPYPIKMGIVRDIRGDISSLDSVRLTTALGLAKYAYGIYEKKMAEVKNLPQNLSAKIVDIFNNYF